MTQGAEPSGPAAGSVLPSVLRPHTLGPGSGVRCPVAEVGASWGEGQVWGRLWSCLVAPAPPLHTDPRPSHPGLGLQLAQLSRGRPVVVGH